ncbi:MAG TPA: iron-containing alcohol dehydrogenase [Candidatus Bathyarchaeia archaeon]|nr:iron-containing alcohol dehydrogenase [Candidatus Bathyarchaeia archaeon]
MIIEFHQPNLFIFGQGALSKITDVLVRLNVNSPLVVSDDGVRKAGLTDLLLEKMPLQAEVFSGFSGEPTLQLATSVIEKVREGGFDSVIAIGGGSALDVGKIAALLATNEGQVADCFVSKRKFPPLPKILIPTTAGSGSEMSSSAVLKFDDGLKHSITGEDVVADVAIVDSQLSRSCPNEVAASSGIDALSTGLEAYLSMLASPFSDMFATAAVELCFRWLERAVTDKDPEALNGMSLAASLSGVAASTPADVNICHCIAETLGPRYDIPHGKAVAAIMPYMVEFNLDATRLRLRHLTRRLGMRDELSLAPRLKAIVKAVGLDICLKYMGVPREALETTAKIIFKSRQYEYMLPQINPFPITLSSLNKLLEACWKGE